MERVAAGIVVFLTLVILADNETTAPIAVSFAYIILLASAMSVGPVAFGRISSLVGAQPALPATKSPGSSGGLI